MHRLSSQRSLHSKTALTAQLIIRRSGTCWPTIGNPIPWESNPQPFALLTQCSTTEPHRNTTLVVRADSAADSSSLARAPETGSPLSGEQNNMAPLTRAVGSPTLATRREPTSLLEWVLHTISEARAPSTSCLYALKWSFFSTWCPDQGENLSTSEVAVVLSFLQELLDKGRSFDDNCSQIPWHVCVWRLLMPWPQPQSIPCEVNPNSWIDFAWQSS